MALLLTGCSSVAYYGQAIQGQWEILSLQQKVAPLLEDVETPPELRQRLISAAAIRQFAVDDLHLPDSGSYRRYADLQRPYSVWVVFAAPGDTLTPKIWCYPAVGCLSYRGFFRQEEARAFARSLEKAGLDTHLQGVAAYSTLGWFDDPLLNTFLNWPLPALAHLLFHEMAHQQLYVADDTDFNESYAEAVAQAGVRLWLARHPLCPTDRDGYEASLRAKTGFLLLVGQARQQLEQLYQKPVAGDRLAAKSALLSRISQRYQEEKSTWDRQGRYEKWFSQGLNNAKLASVHPYSRWVAAFLRLLADNGGDLAQFHGQAARLAALPQPQREARLRELTP